MGYQKITIIPTKDESNGSFSSTSSKEMELLKNKENRTFIKYIII